MEDAIKKYKITILYASLGGGHKSAAISLKNHLEKEKNVKVELLDYLEYCSKLINSISIGVFSLIVKQAKPIWKIMYDNSNKESSTLHITNAIKLTSLKMLKYFKQSDPDLVISTHPFSTQICTYLKKKNKFKFKLANILTDFEVHSLWYYEQKYMDYIFVSSSSMKKALIEAKVDENKIFITGIPIKEEFYKEYNKNIIYKDFDLDPNKETIIFFGGGNQGFAYKETYVFLNCALKHFKDYNIIVISGKNKKVYEKFKNIIEENNASSYTKLFFFSKRIPELMNISEFIISKPGGLTTSEALATGTPILIISPLPGHEIANCKYIVRNKAGIYINSEYKAEKTFKKIANNPEIIKKLQDGAKKIGNPNSTKIITDMLLKDI